MHRSFSLVSPRIMCTTGAKDLIHSPGAHQKLLEITPKQCSLVHQKGCDLEEVEGAAPLNIHSLRPCSPTYFLPLSRWITAWKQVQRLWSKISWLKSCITRKDVNTQVIPFMDHIKGFGQARSVEPEANGLINRSALSDLITTEPKSKTRIRQIRDKKELARPIATKSIQAAAATTGVNSDPQVRCCLQAHCSSF